MDLARNAGSKFGSDAGKWLRYAALTALFATALSACGGDLTATPNPAATSGASDAQELTITAKDNLFEPKSYTAVAGKPIKLTVINAGQNVHEVEVVDLLPETQLAAGQSKTVEVAAQQPGTHRIYCEIHEDAGMEGELVIK